jgi:5'(3')-deoxyribonucleotidase
MTLQQPRTIYLDMDGVVADWLAGATRIIGYELTDPNAMYCKEDWDKLRSDKRIFRTLPKTADADQLVDLARRFRSELDYNLAFLTAIPHNNDMPHCFQDKVEWVQQYYPDIPVLFGPYSKDKYRHCKPGDILVDDRADNCAAWSEAGGRAIKVGKKNDLSTALVVLAEILQEECEARQR